MASHGAAKEIAATMPPAPKQPKIGAFHHMELAKAENGGAVAQHFHEFHHPDGYSNVREHGNPHAFGEGDGHKLAKHIETHLGIKMPGKSSTESAAPMEGDET